MKLKLIPILRSAFDAAYIAITFITSLLALTMAVSMVYKYGNPTPEFSTSVSYMTAIIITTFIGKIAFHFYDSYKGAN